MFKFLEFLGKWALACFLILGFLLLSDWSLKEFLSMNDQEAKNVFKCFIGILIVFSSACLAFIYRLGEIAWKNLRLLCGQN